VRGHDQTDIRRRAGARLLIALVVAIAGHAGRGPARGQDAPTASWKGDEAAPIRLSADHVQAWTEGGTYCVLLEDGAEVAQGDVSIVARRVVARIDRAGRVGGSIHRVAVYAEEEVRDPASPGQTYPDVRLRMVTTDQFKLVARAPGGMHELNRPPPGYPILARAFPGQPPTPDRPKPVGRPASATAAASRARETAARKLAPVAPVPSSLPVALEATPVADPGPPAPAGKVTLMPMPAPTSASASAPADPAVRRTQDPGGAAFPDEFSTLPMPDQVPPPAVDPLPLAPDTVPLGPGSGPTEADPPTTLVPMPDGSPRPARPGAGPAASGEDANVVVLPGSQRVTTIYPRGLGEIQLETLERQADGTQILVIRNGVNIQTRTVEQGIVDIEADNVVIWLRGGGRGSAPRLDFNNQIVSNVTDPIEFYLEGHVIFRQDQLRLQGRSDQRTYQAERAYYDVQRDKLLTLNAQVELFAPGLITPTKIKSPRIFQYHPEVAAPDGRRYPSSLAAIQADQTVTTGSRFANPGYRFTSKSIDVRQVVDTQAVPDPGASPFDRDDLTWQIDARQNFFFFGPVPVFYYPRLFVEADDLDPPLQGISFSTNNFFGQQVRTDFDVFNLLSRRHPPEIDVWNLDVDYLSARDKRPGQGIALGSEIGWYGQDLINDINDPFHKDRTRKPSPLTSYAGYFDIYGLFDGSRDVLGLGPAVITNSPDNNAAGRAGYTRLSNPTFQDFRGRLTARHMQSLLPKDASFDEDFRLNLEVGFVGRTDRNFLEQYFKRLFDTGLDQENLAYLIRQKENRAFTVLAETNLQTFNTETQWYPKGDYYRLGDSFLNNRLTYFQHTGADFANVHTAAEVNNKTIFAYLPIDPVSNTKGTFQSGRIYTTHELDLPINLNFMRITPYLQGQAVGWNNQIAGHAVGRLWGAAGARADITLWKAYPNAESELLNIHGLNHKIDFVADYRDAYSNVPLNSLGVQDDLDDNAYEYTRRYFALTNYGGGVLPPQYDPRFLTLRRALSPLTGPTDIQASIDTLKLGIHQRLQTKRGQEGKRHITDYMIFDLDTTYFPQASRDNFGKPFGQNFYNYEWYIGDRTSLVSYGWFEFFKVTGDPFFQNTSRLRNDPFGLHIITSGISITRIPKGNIFIGYTIVNTGPISTSALNASYSYWMSPKWFMTTGTSYDFGTGYLLGASGSLTRIGADYLTSVGLAASPLQHSYQFVFEITPRLSPNLKLGSASGLARLDPRFAPVE